MASASSSAVAASSVPTWRVMTAIRCPEAYGKAFRMRKASRPRLRMRARRSSPVDSAAQNTHAASGPPAVETYAIRQGAQSRSTD